MGVRRVWLPILLAVPLGLSACTVPGSDVRVAVAPPIALDSYAWLDRSDALLDAIENAPPDFVFDHRGDELFAWDVSGALIVEESSADGYTLYIFERGPARPSYLRTPDFAAGFDRGRLAVIYTRDGQLITDPILFKDEDEALALHRRGSEIFEAARYARWDGDAAAAWAAIEIVIQSQRSRWIDRWRGDRNWQNYRRRAEADASRAALQGERQRRREAGQRYRAWRDGGFAGAPPPGLGRRDRDGRDWTGRGRRDDVRPDRPRDGNVGRPDRPRREDGGTRPDRPRRDDGGVRPDRPRREEGGVRPDRPRREDGGTRPDRPRREDGGTRPDRPRRDDTTAPPDTPSRPPRDRPAPPRTDPNPPPVTNDPPPPPRPVRNPPPPRVVDEPDAQPNVADDRVRRRIERPVQPEDGALTLPASAIEEEAARRRREEASRRDTDEADRRARAAQREAEEAAQREAQEAAVRESREAAAAEGRRLRVEEAQREALAEQARRDEAAQRDAADAAARQAQDAANADAARREQERAEQQAADADAARRRQAAADAEAADQRRRADEAEAARQAEETAEAERRRREDGRLRLERVEAEPQ